MSCNIASSKPSGGLPSLLHQSWTMVSTSNLLSTLADAPNLLAFADSLRQATTSPSLLTLQLRLVQAILVTVLLMTSAFFELAAFSSGYLGLEDAGPRINRQQRSRHMGQLQALTCSTKRSMSTAASVHAAPLQGEQLQPQACPPP